MYKEKIFSGNMMECVADEFAEMVSRDYLKELLFWKCTLMYDEEEYHKWVEEAKNQATILKQKVYQRILDIMKKPEENEEFYKKNIFGKRKNIIKITRSTKFYDDLLPVNNTKVLISANTEYLIHTKRWTLEKKVYPPYKRNNSQ